MIDLDIPDATVFLLKYPGESEFSRLYEEIEWQSRTINIYGRKLRQPRLIGWYGDEDAIYRYSGTTNEPAPWSPLLLRIRQEVEGLLECSFNSVLLNLYRSGKDSIGFHSDNEPELGSEPIIASLSFGAARTFVFKHKQKLYSPVEVELGDCDLLIMLGETQRHWLHGIEKCANAEPRINLTFRRILRG